jgi:hypothetical protein
MTAKPPIFAFIVAVLLLSTLSASPALAKPEMTLEQLAKAREIATKMNPPIDFDAMLAEANRLGVECEDDLTRRAAIKMCMLDVDTAQSKERQQASRKRQAKLDEEYKASQERTKKMLEEIKQTAKEKLKQK